VSASLAASPWYCSALLRLAGGLATLAHRLDQAAQRRGLRASPGASPVLDALRACEMAEERLREIRLRSLRYY